MNFERIVSGISVTAPQAVMTEVVAEDEDEDVEM